MKPNEPFINLVEQTKLIIEGYQVGGFNIKFELYSGTYNLILKRKRKFKKCRLIFSTSSG